MMLHIKGEKSPILEYGAACWDPYREQQISALDRVQKKAAKFAHHTNSPHWETLASRRKLSRICALFKAYSGERAWKSIGDRLQRPHYLNRLDHEKKIRSMGQRTDIGKYIFVNRTIQHWNQIPAGVLGTLPCNRITFKKRVRKVIIELNWKEVKERWKSSKSEEKQSIVKRRVKSEVKSKIDRLI